LTPYPNTNANYKLEKKEYKKRNIKQLKEIQGYKGQGSIDYPNLLRHFTIQINFINLVQMSPDFAKNIQSLITRVNKKKSKKKRTSNYMPLAIEEEEEILAIKAIVKSNITNKLKTTIEANMANVSLKLVSFY